MCPADRFGVLADVHIIGDRIELLDLSLYPVGPDHLPVGASQIRAIYREIESSCVQLGFKRLRMTAERLSGAGRGSRVDLERSLQ
jgi:hypothetical protein